MAYRHFSGAPFMYCRADTDNIQVKEFNGVISKYACSLGFSTDWQLNAFEGSAQWCLEKDGIMCVGRPDSTFSGFNKDGLLVKYGVWDFPYARRFEEVGQKDGCTAIAEAGGRVVYIMNRRMVYVLKNPLPKTDMSLSMVEASLMSPELVIHIMGGGRINEREAGVWVNTPEQGWSDIRIYL